jgi:DNA-binding MarR family transcriptional regulator
MEGLSLKELAARRHVDAPTACRVVMTLTRKGLVRAHGDPRDRRRSCLGLTPRGAETIRQVYPLALELRSAMARGVSSAELAAARRVLQKVMANMERFEVQPDVAAGTGPARRSA